jgi:uncharacterized protein YjbI with pentapeptide repeats
MPGLTHADVARLVARHRADFRGENLAGIDLTGASTHALTDVRFGVHPVQSGRPPARLTGARFRGNELLRCSFAHAVLEDVDLRGCTLIKCDFRYVIFRRATLENATVVDCDFYRAVFEEGCIVADAHFESVSLTHAWLHGMVGVRRATFVGTPGKPALAAEANLEQYAEFLRPTLKDRFKRLPAGAALRDRLEEAALVYRHLSGVWTAQGHYDDATWAYVRTKELERQYAKARRSDPSCPPRERRKDLRRWALLSVANALCRYGDGLGRVFAWIAAVAVVPGLVLWLGHGIESTDAHASRATWWQALLFGVGRLGAFDLHRLQTSGYWADGVVVTQSVVGIALLGLLGFVLGGKLRGS